MRAASRYMTPPVQRPIRSARSRSPARTTWPKRWPHPTTFYSGTRDEGDFGPYDWLTTDASAMNDRLWETMTDSGKTLFDPCPPGWRVPRKESWTGLNETNFIWDDAALGRRHALLGYYPAAGSRGAATGEWNFVGGSGLYWSSSATEDCYVSKLNFLPAYINVQSNANRASGFPVRCVSETVGDPGEDPGTIEKYELDRVTESAYIGFAGDDASANYYIGLSNVPFELSDEGEPVSHAAGMIMYLDLYGDTSIDPKSAVLPDGTYTVRSETTSGSANATYTWARMMTDEHEIVYRRTTGGKVKVRRTDSGYSIEGTFRSTDGPDFTISYTGEIAFTDRTPGPSVLPIVDPVNARFTEAVAQWEYSGDQSDRFTIRLLDGRMENDELAEGYRLTIDLLSEKLSEKGNIVIQPGRYSIGSDYVSPMTFSVGALYSLMGIPMYTGTYCQQGATRRPHAPLRLCVRRDDRGRTLGRPVCVHRRYHHRRGGFGQRNLCHERGDLHRQCALRAGGRLAEYPAGGQDRDFCAGRRLRMSRLAVRFGRRGADRI